MIFEVTRLIEEVHVRVETIEIEAESKEEAVKKAIIVGDDEDKWEFQDYEFSKEIGTPARFIATEIVYNNE